MTVETGLADSFGRRITYLRMSVTDRCDLRCRYCMSEQMQFLPRRDLLSFDELARIAERFVARGIRRIRLTGGEPLSRAGLPVLAARIGGLLGEGGLQELTLTTNGMRLGDHARALFDAGVRRINVSLDSLRADRFRAIARRDGLETVLRGIDEGCAAGLAIKINMVVLKGVNDDEVASMVDWCGAQGHDLSLIETMPLGHVDDRRVDQYVALDTVRDALASRFTLVPSAYRTGGSPRYYEVRETGRRLGLITPMSNNFCDGCNRIRLTVDGRLYMCLGHDDQIDLKSAYRDGGVAALDSAIDAALGAKPLRHTFRIGAGAGPALDRHMSVTGG